MKHGVTEASTRFRRSLQAIYEWRSKWDVNSWKSLVEKIYHPHHHPAEHIPEEKEMILRRYPLYKNDMKPLSDSLRQTCYTRSCTRNAINVTSLNIVTYKIILSGLIDHINVYEVQGTGKNKTKRLVIYYKFVGYLDIDPTQCHPNYTADIREGVAVEYVSCEPSENIKELCPEEYDYDREVPEKEETEQA